LLPSDVEQWSAERVIAYLLEQFPGKVALACSFQKEETILLDMLLTLDANARVFAIDTHHLFPETYAYWREVERRYGMAVETFEGDPVEDKLWETKPDLYLAIAKVAPLVRALGELDAWITGIRREQGPTRADSQLIERDENRGLWKYNPLAHWSEKDLWRRIHERELPYNLLHDQGYESIGCAPCTQPGSGREGRWAGTDKTECGIHVEVVDPSHDAA